MMSEGSKNVDIHFTDPNHIVIKKFFVNASVSSGVPEHFQEQNFELETPITDPEEQERVISRFELQFRRMNEQDFKNLPTDIEQSGQGDIIQYYSTIPLEINPTAKPVNVVETLHRKESKPIKVKTLRFYPESYSPKATPERETKTYYSPKPSSPKKPSSPPPSEKKPTSPTPSPSGRKPYSSKLPVKTSFEEEKPRETTETLDEIMAKLKRLQEEYHEEKPEETQERLLKQQEKEEARKEAERKLNEKVEEERNAPKESAEELALKQEAQRKRMEEEERRRQEQERQEAEARARQEEEDRQFLERQEKAKKEAERLAKEQELANKAISSSGGIPEVSTGVPSQPTGPIQKIYYAEQDLASIDDFMKNRFAAYHPQKLDLDSAKLDISKIPSNIIKPCVFFYFVEMNSRFSHGASWTNTSTTLQKIFDNFVFVIIRNEIQRADHRFQDFATTYTGMVSKFLGKTVWLEPDSYSVKKLDYSGTGKGTITYITDEENMYEDIMALLATQHGGSPQPRKSPSPKPAKTDLQIRLEEEQMRDKLKAEADRRAKEQEIQKKAKQEGITSGGIPEGQMGLIAIVSEPTFEGKLHYEFIVKKFNEYLEHKKKNFRIKIIEPSDETRLRGADLIFYLYGATTPVDNDQFNPTLYNKLIGIKPANKVALIVYMIGSHSGIESYRGLPIGRDEKSPIIGITYRKDPEFFEIQNITFEERLQDFLKQIHTNVPTSPRASSKANRNPEKEEIVEKVLPFFSGPKVTSSHPSESILAPQKARTLLIIWDNLLFTENARKEFTKTLQNKIGVKSGIIVEQTGFNDTEKIKRANAILFTNVYDSSTGTEFDFGITFSGYSNSKTGELLALNKNIILAAVGIRGHLNARYLPSKDSQDDRRLRIMIAATVDGSVESVGNLFPLPSRNIDDPLVIPYK